MYKVKNGLSPSFMNDIFTYNEKREKFFLPYARTTKMGQGSLRVFGPIVWNTMLPKNLKESPSLNIFKERIKSWIPNNCKCRLCNDHNNDCSCHICKWTPWLSCGLVLHINEFCVFVLMLTVVSFILTSLFLVFGFIWFKLDAEIYLFCIYCTVWHCVTHPGVKFSSPIVPLCRHVPILGHQSGGHFIWITSSY